SVSPGLSWRFYSSPCQTSQISTSPLEKERVSVIRSHAASLFPGVRENILEALPGHRGSRSSLVSLRPGRHVPSKDETPKTRPGLSRSLHRVDPRAEGWEST